MKNFWISWWHPIELTFELNSAWWITGYRDGATSICAAIKAENEEAAMQIIDAAYGENVPPYEIRFVDDRDDDWSPYNDRFQKADWMPEW